MIQAQVKLVSRKLEAMVTQKQALARRVMQLGRKPTTTEDQRMRELTRRIVMYRKALSRANDRQLLVESQHETLSSILDTKQDAEFQIEFAKDLRGLGLVPDKVEKKLDKADDQLQDAQAYQDAAMEFAEGFIQRDNFSVDVDEELENAWTDVGDGPAHMIMISDDSTQPRTQMRTKGTPIENKAVQRHTSDFVSLRDPSEADSESVFSETTYDLRPLDEKLHNKHVLLEDFGS